MAKNAPLHFATRDRTERKNWKKKHLDEFDLSKDSEVYPDFHIEIPLIQNSDKLPPKFFVIKGGL